ncbi:transcriptional regulator GcvA [Sinorhizobium psoraleae]|uniref:Transcriptional regulator GcvA n=1 Tax=Sinorhizobium psoraleae TaxID=520838 RepID=A0ABT4K9X8_9HYPH|nr:transcriptional regulator GcvA [Sinorhizobium psoraleae]MCZ4088620.1 transcriptional regulator GcvA [Sinorhizobium psoraleae]
MNRKSPVYLNALRAFEASARHGSFSGAAKELNVTAAAVGQMVRGLEEWLGMPLFYRRTSGKARLTLTENAEHALADIRAGLDRLGMGLDRLRESGTGGILNVTVSPAFAAKWLLPRIDRFQSRCPETDIRLETSLNLIDYKAHGIDVGVRYGDGNWAGLVAEKLMEEEIFPVCSPSFTDASRIAEPADLARSTLIHDLSVDPAIGFITWDMWLRSAGVHEGQAQRGMRIDNSAAVLQAAIEGRGVALARSILARDDLAAGRLRRLFPEVQVSSKLAYYVVYRAEYSSLPKLRTFRDWLMEEALKP